MIIDYNKYSDGLVPAIIQDVNTGVVLMLGFMNEAAVNKTKEGKVTFFSRSKNRLWTKGEESGNFLLFKEIKVDCDNDTLLIKAEPLGPVCHTGADTCWSEKNDRQSPPVEGWTGQYDDKHKSPNVPAGVGPNFLCYLEEIINSRKAGNDESSYVKKMFRKGINKLAQKVGEEAVELVIEAKDDNEELFLGEAADLMFHYLLLLNAKGYTLQNVIDVLQARHAK
jgi:phosphoribosyl-AMP cyclohydrolase / phosphoribosyl-ATP pyrophosphohydrolase